MGPNKKQKLELSFDNNDWISAEEDAELLLDVYQDEKNIYIVSAVAGVDPAELDISVNNDMLTIRGNRTKSHDIEGADYFYQECYWGRFSRSIILPVEIKTDEIDAEIKNGVLKITLPKTQRHKNIPIKIKG